QDPTGLTHIGARHYDPTQGRFISPDPLVNPDNPQTLNAYAYANNNPTTHGPGVVPLCLI
ncbi:RHS repeat-associated core domain-containing protein, partial [Micromonospora sp. LOL_023]|uniref:RHS repeat-associated core domain-containing protein n=1 Tax=Micromonospora sp. LOL_023 TaxID=3345418 RepID=UPI003A86813E